jgi:2-hydroxy-3-keto-5-methylthiopentenyl-1-phosphate phosphatase
MRNWIKSTEFNFTKIKCVIFDFGFTLSSEFYFNVFPPDFPLWQNVIQQKIFSDANIVDEWMSGKISIRHIAELLRNEINLDVSEIVEFMEMGCENLEFNMAVLDFAISIRNKGVKTAIVTGNMDVFTNVVVPSHQLDEKFDVILNSFDYQELDKAVLWPIAFNLLGSEIEYSNSLLIEDGSQNVEKFRNYGGYAYKYSNDQEFLMWLDEIKL